MDERTYERTNKRTNERTNEWTNERSDNVTSWAANRIFENENKNESQMFVLLSIIKVFISFLISDIEKLLFQFLEFYFDECQLSQIIKNLRSGECLVSPKKSIRFVSLKMIYMKKKPQVGNFLSQKNMAVYWSRNTFFPLFFFYDYSVLSQMCSSWIVHIMVLK